jgi:HKD family nuclease
MVRGLNVLDPRKNRMDYGEQLVPPSSDYDLEFAVGTTYSLDMNTLVLLPVALFHSRLLDSKPDDVRPELLDALSRAPEKIRVYCQKGKMKVPEKYHPLMSYWEDGIVPVHLDGWNRSFHPKIWLARFSAKDLPTKYRLVITSRNLTDSHDWDIAFSTDGDMGEKDNDRNQPLIDFLNYLSSQGENPLPNEFITGLSRTVFDLPHPFHLMTFHPIGIENKKKDYRNPLASRSWDELAVVSPFVDDATLRLLSGKASENLHLLSRSEELDTVSPDLLKSIGKDHLWEFSQNFENAGLMEELQDDSSQEPVMQNLHAKLFVGKKEPHFHWFIGSANATSPAIERNIEFLVELKSEKRGQSVRELLKNLTQEIDKQLPLFDQYKIKKAEVVTKSADTAMLRRLLYDLTGAKYSGRAVERHTDSGVLYDLEITADLTGILPLEGFTLCFRPVAEPSERRIELPFNSKSVVSDFRGYSEAQLSPYLAMFVTSKDITKSFLIPMEIELPKTRFRSIYRSLINSRDKLMAFLAFLLGHVETDALLNDSALPTGHLTQTQTGTQPNLTPLYEDLMIAASRRPDRLDAVAKVIESLTGDEPDTANPIVPPELMELWAMFSKFRKTKP